MEEADVTAEKERKIPGIPFTKGDPRINYAGRPKGSISPITKIKQIFEDKPEAFEAFVTEYMADPANRKHLVEMLDGKPRQNIGLDGGEDNKPIVFVSEAIANKYATNTSTDTNSTG